MTSHAALLLCMGAGILMVLISIPMMRAWLPRNHWYGFRTAKTLSADRIWYPANRYSGWTLFLAGLATVAITLALLPFAGLLSPDTAALLGTAALVVPLFVSVWHSFRFLRTLH